MRKFIVSGMSCAACQARVEKAVNSVPGVTACSVSLLTNSLSVEGSASDEAIIAAVEKAGYGAGLQDAARTTDSGSYDAAKTALEDRETPQLIRRLIASIILLIALMLCRNGYFQMGITIGIMVINRRFFISGIRSVLHGGANMDTLVAMGSGISFLWSVYTLFTGDGDLYFESAAMILTLITVGKTLEARSKGKTTNALKSLLENAPMTATIIRDGEEIDVPASSLKPGDIFIVRPGNMVPVDGIVLDGETGIDESALTGESALVTKTPGSSVAAATMNLKSRIRCEATRVGEDTTYSQIIQMVSDTAATKAPIAKTADRVASIFVPTVIGIAIVTLAVWMLLGRSIEFALARAIAVLVISCPCALGLATPVAIMVGSGVGARHGILFKTAASLEETGRVNIVALDKTGTITKGNPRLDGAAPEVDVIREDSRSAIRELRNMGIRVVMLTGDKKETAERIAEEAGVDEVISELLPGGKQEAVRELMKQGRVAMVGDGINDAPALTLADAGIAIGAGTDIAIDAASVVLMNSRLSDVTAAIRLSRATLRNIRQNLFWAFIYNIIGIPLAAGCYIGLLGWQLSPVFGAAAMSLSSFCVVTNALRLNLFKFNTTDSTAINITDGGTLERSSDDKETTMTKTLKIEGMMCPHCEARVKKTLEAIDGVELATVSHELGTAVVDLAADIDNATLKSAVEAQGYTVTSIE